MAKQRITAREKKDMKEFFEALRIMEQERGIPREFIAEKIAEAITVASRKDYGGNDIVVCDIDTENEIFEVFAKKEIVEEVENPFTQISVAEAKKIDPKSIKEGFIKIKIDPKKFGRIVAQNSKNNFRQGVRAAEKDQFLADFQSKNRELVTAHIERIDPKTGNAILTIGHNEATLPKIEQVSPVAVIPISRSAGVGPSSRS